LHRVIRQRFGGRIDSGQSSADHDYGQAELEIRDRVGLGRARELQRHQEIGRLPHAAGQAVLHRDHRGASRARAQGHVIEAHLEGAIDGHSAAEAHAAEHAELRAPFQQQPDQLEKILVPANGDAVFGYAAKARHDPVVQRLVQLVYVVDGTERGTFPANSDSGNVGGQRLDLQSVDADHRVAVVHQMMRQRKSSRAQSDHQHLVSGIQPRNGPREVERIPARQQAVNLEAPRQFQHVLQSASFHLRDVHRILLLENARLHAVIADAVTRARCHRIVDSDNRQRADRVSLLLD